ncbi:helix-turn-helix domain-containing protein [Eubacterium sp. MSJ-33]|uniref:helix-turn-helix domain-containing protein n=1 Tax=Eubacterium sp. MSJ-33 TaxID=2841528 RepID=UPI001C76659C|nr:helix-turn-helix transcriptional regulator [Eubacterium sp. MSJ-33]QWT52099.1 helix-turn-helix transcriptional regulator [Eubacterium sp. MSJ-33]
MKIKQTYLSRVTGIDENKLSRLLAGSREESGTDMEKIAPGLGKSIEFFLKDCIVVPHLDSFAFNKNSFYAGEPSAKQEKVSKDLMELMENIDEILSAESRLENVAMGQRLCFRKYQ